MSCSLPTLYDLPISNHGARCRWIIYEKGLEEKVQIKSPAELGGLKSPEYLVISPQGKMPVLVTEDGSAVPESDTISRYLLDKFSDVTPSFKLPTLEQRTRAEAIARHHDTYISTIQSCLYRAAPPFGIFGERSTALSDLKRQLQVLEGLMDDSGPFAAGAEVSLADATIFPTYSCTTHSLFAMLQFGFTPDEIAGPKLSKWWNTLSQTAVGKRIKGEIEAPLNSWQEAGRWDSIMFAGQRDTAESTIFDKILSKEIPSTMVFEDDLVYAFKDINPVAPTHVLIIPKHRNGLTRLANATPENGQVLGRILQAAATISAQEKLEGFRLVINDGPSGGQEVYHLHAHLISGRQMGSLG
ncbi:unnamed protein product [Chrysoparadoxa australica]